MRTIDLFSGCGGMSLGFSNAGFEITAAFDYWDAAIKVYKKNFDHPVVKCNLGELKEYDMFTTLLPTAIIGGPPCQDFSHAGKRNEDLGRADLTVSFAHIIESVRPKIFVMENVERALTSKKFKIAEDIFLKSGYGISKRIIDASLCGVPQKRKRLFVIGVLGANFNDEIGCYLDKSLAKKPTTIREYFNSVNEEIAEFYYRHPRNYSRRGIYSIDEPSATIRGVNRPLPANYPGHPMDAVPVSADVKPLTTKQRGLIQTFPTDFAFIGTKTDVEQMIGNAVPVKLAEHVAQVIKQYLNDLDNNIVQITAKNIIQTVTIQDSLFETAW